MYIRIIVQCVYRERSKGTYNLEYRIGICLYLHRIYYTNVILQSVCANNHDFFIMLFINCVMRVRESSRLINV